MKTHFLILVKNFTNCRQFPVHVKSIQGHSIWDHTQPLVSEMTVKAILLEVRPISCLVADLMDIWVPWLFPVSGYHVQWLALPPTVLSNAHSSPGPCACENLLGPIYHRGQEVKDTHRGTIVSPLAFSSLEKKRQNVSVWVSGWRCLRGKPACLIPW